MLPAPPWIMRRGVVGEGDIVKRVVGKWMVGERGCRGMELVDFY